MLEVTIYDARGQEQAKFDGEDEFDFVSLVSPGTYGPPALVAPKGGEPPLAQIEDRVLYINTGYVPMFSLERTM